MQVLENRILTFRTRQPEKYSIIPKCAAIGENNGVYEMAVSWGYEEARILKNLGVKDVPSPIKREYNWPGLYKPMEHQIETAGFLTMHHRAFCFNDPGTGKSLSCLWAADYLMNKRAVRRVLILCPLSIMNSAWLADLSKSILHRSAAIAYASTASKRKEIVNGGYEFVISNYDGLEIIDDEIIKDGRFDLVIVDECFVAGTQISTPSGPRAIETLVAGEKVLTSSGAKRIKRLVCNNATALVEVRLSNGKTIKCTPEHPFFTELGWVTAKNLNGRRLVSEAAMSYVRSDISVPEEQMALVAEQQTGIAHWSSLFTILRAEEDSCSATRTSPMYSRTPIGKTRKGAFGDDPFRGIQKENVGTSKSLWPQTPDSWGERDWPDSYGETDSGNIPIPNMELPNSVGREAAWLSYMLQSRFRTARTENSSGSGRRITRSVSQETAGQKKGEETFGVRVESVSYIEQGGGTPVFNLEIEGTPNYYADGCLVHNCNSYKNITTRKWKVLNKVLRPTTRLWMLTGTPAPQSPVDAFGLAKFVNPNAVPKFTGAWRDKVLVKVAQFKWKPRPEAPQIVFNALQPAIRFTKEQCLDLPPVVLLTREIPLTPQQDKYYKQMKREQLVKAAGETISSANAAIVINKLLQISSGAVYSDEGATIDFDCAPRLNALLEVLEETDRKVIVFVPFKHAIEKISGFLRANGCATEIINGDVSLSDRTRIFKDFQRPGEEPRVVLIQPQAAAHGVTLTTADTVVFWGPVSSVELYKQAIARADRIGQDSNKVTVIHLQGSPVEQKMYKQLQGNLTQNELLTSLYEEEFNT